ncbi:MAG: hypothetical protein RR482_02340 [Clostridia bacterium]
MSLELFERIQTAEANADAIRAEAQREARDMLKSVEAACLAEERRAAQEHRAGAQRKLEDAQQKMEKELEQEKAAHEKARQTVNEAAKARLPQAAALIFERVVNNGHR